VTFEKIKPIIDYHALMMSKSQMCILVG